MNLLKLTIGVLILTVAFSGKPTLAADRASPPTKPNPATDPAWECVSDEIFKKIGVYDMTPNFQRRCVGMIVTPKGEIFVLASKNNGVCVSRDHGATWEVVADNKVTGRCESGFGFSIAYPYDGRFAFFTIDGTGGMTLDAGKTWQPFTRILRMFEFADVDWTAKEPRTIFGLLHEPFFTVLSTDGGKSWLQLYKDEEAAKDAQKSVRQYHLGLIDSKTLVRAIPSQPGMSMSTDGGKSWAEVAKYTLLGRRPVHYGKKAYWAAAEGVIVSENGKDWSLVGTGLERATYGPYFGTSENEMMVVTEKGFFITRDGAKTWTLAAPPFGVPDGISKKFEKNGGFCYFGWDPVGNYLYASQLGGSCYRTFIQRP